MSEDHSNAIAAFYVDANGVLRDHQHRARPDVMDCIEGDGTERLDEEATIAAATNEADR